MKFIMKYFFFSMLLAAGFCACDKVDDLPFYPNGTAPVLSSSVTEIAAAPADSMNVVVTFSWTNPHYATDSNNVKYILQIDSAGRNFSKAVNKEVMRSLQTSFTAKELNDILLGFGFAFGVSYNIEVRVLSSYANNNEQYASNTIVLKATPYVVPPKVTPPASGTLFIVGSATAGGWNNPVPEVVQQFTKLTPLTYQGTFYLKGGSEYLLLPVNGSWSEKYAVEDNTIPGLNAGGSFGYYSEATPTVYNSNFPSPATTGLYTITVDFQHGKFSVTLVKAYASLYVPGDYQGWNPSSAPSLASVNADGNYEGYVYIPNGGTYEFKLTSEPSWNGTNYGDGGGGTLSTSGGNMKVTTGGYYKMNANTVSNTWSATATTWGLIGSFNGWSGDADMVYDASSNVWRGTINVPANGEFKFRANHLWDLNYGDDGTDGTLNEGGANIPISAGTHTITLDLHNAGYYYYKIE